MSEPIPETGLPEDEYDPDMPPDPEPGPDPDPVEGWSEADVAGERVALSGSPIVAGTPGGARIEIRSTGVHAFNGTGTETAFIQGEGGEFVGGEFRTSDALPGQVTLSDTAYVDSYGGVSRPGIGVTPVDTSDMDTAPGIGANGNAMMLNGGRNLDGDKAHIALSPANLYMETSHGDGRTSYLNHSPDVILFRADSEVEGSYSRMRVTESEIDLYSHDFRGHAGRVRSYVDSAVVEYRNDDGQISGRVYAGANSAYLVSYDAARNERRLSVDSDGVWVRAGSGEWYNLEETAQDSGWQPFSLESGFTGSASLAWRNKGGIIWFRGTVTGDFVSGYNYVARNLDEAIRPEFNVFTNAVGIDNKDVSISMNSAGHIAIIPPTGRTATISMSGLLYPIG